MTAWTVLLEVDADREAVNNLRTMLQDLLELTTGNRPRTKTVESWMLNAALKRANDPPVHPVSVVRDPATPLWEGPTIR